MVSGWVFLIVVGLVATHSLVFWIGRRIEREVFIDALRRSHRKI